MIQSQPVHWHRSKGARNDFSTSGSWRTYFQKRTKEDEASSKPSRSHPPSMRRSSRFSLGRMWISAQVREYDTSNSTDNALQPRRSSTCKKLKQRGCMGSCGTYLATGRPQSAELCISNTLSSSPTYRISCAKFEHPAVRHDGQLRAALNIFIPLRNPLCNLSATAPSTTSESWWSPQQPGDPSADLQTLETHASASRSRISGK